MQRVPQDDDELAALRARMGDAEFEEAWAYGRSLAGRRAVEYALHGEPPDPTRHRARPPLQALVSSLRHRGNAAAPTG